MLAAQPNVAPVLEARQLVKQYPGVRAVDELSLQVREGSCFGLLGPNGAGKTTTVEMLEGITPPTSGEVLFRGRPLGRDFREHAGIQFQSTALQDFLTVGETLAYFQQLYRQRLPLDELIEMCALADILKRDNRKLSGGQRQRLLLAIALVNDPQVLFLDEPTTGLDPQARRRFWSLVETIKARGKTIVLTTHYMEEAYVLCDDIAIVDHGHIIAEGTPRDLLEAHFGDLVLELPRSDFTLPAEGFAYPVAELRERVEISTSDVEGALSALRSAGVPLTRLRIRDRTLEDLFLELTGRELRA